MTKDKIIEFLKAIGCKVPNSQPRSGWIVSDCRLGPWRHEGGKSNGKALGVRVESGIPFTNCLSCGFHGSASEYLMEIRGREQRGVSGLPCDYKTAFACCEEADGEFELNLDGPDYAEQLALASIINPFSEAWLASFKPALAAKIAREYLSSRNVPEPISEALDLRYDASQRRVCFPVRDFANRLVGLHGRAIDKGVDPRYRMYQWHGLTNPLCWLGESWVDVSKPVVIVEGPFDLASVARVYRNIVSPLFANPSYDKIQRMSDALSCVTLLDQGKAGDEGRARFSKAMHNAELFHLVPPKGIKDPGVMTIDELHETLSPYVEMSETVW